jgi:hypothetical protein
MTATDRRSPTVSPDEFTVSAQRPLTDLFGLSRVSRGALPVRNVCGYPVLDDARESRPTLRACTAPLAMGRAPPKHQKTSTSEELRDHGSTSVRSLTPSRSETRPRPPLLMTRMYIAAGATAASRAEQAPALSPLTDHIAVSAAIRPWS